MESKWQEISFGNCLIGKVRNGIYKSKEFHGEGKKIVNMGELFSNPRLSTSIEMKRLTISEDEFERFGIRQGDLLFARRSLTAEGAGKCIWVMEVSEDAVFESSIIRARVQEDSVDSQYLYYYFNSSVGKNGLASILRQVAVSGITGSDLMGLTIHLPPLPIQRQIAAILSAFDDKIELNRQMNRTLEQMARALFKSWFVDFDPVRAKMRGEVPEGMDAETAALFPDELVEVEGREMPKGWTWQTVDQLYKLHGGSTPSTGNPDYWEGGEYHWSSPKDMSGLDVPFLTHTDKKITESGTRVISSGILPSGTLLLSSRAPVGYMAVADMPISINQGYIALEPTGPLGRYFTLNLLQSQLDEVKAMASGTTFPELSKKTFRQFEVLTPASGVAAAFEISVEGLYGKIRESIYESEELAQLRDTLLPELLSGAIELEVVQ